MMASSIIAGVERLFGIGSEFSVDQVCGFCDDHGGGDERAFGILKEVC